MPMSTSQEKLSNRQLKELRDAFNLFDQDKSGSISTSELKQVLKALNMKPTDNLVRKLMKDMDVDGSGAVDFEEFAKVMAQVYTSKFTDDEMRQAFKCFDTDNSGHITINELQDVLRRMNQSVDLGRLQRILQKIDTDQDGKISYEEFVRLLQEL